MRGTRARAALTCLVAFALAAEAVYIGRGGEASEGPVVQVLDSADLPRIAYRPRVGKAPVVDTAEGDEEEAEGASEQPLEEEPPAEPEEAPEVTDDSTPQPPEPDPQPPKPPEER